MRLAEERNVPLVAAAGRAEPSPTERGRYPLEWRTVQRTVETWVLRQKLPKKNFLLTIVNALITICGPLDWD